MTTLRAFLAVFAASLILTACSFDLMGSDDAPAKPPRPAYEPADPAAFAKMQEFLAKNKARPGIKTLDNGIQYRVVKSGEGKGRKATWASTVVVRYRGSLIDGKVFDQTEAGGPPATLELNQLVEGWQEIIPLMRYGDTWEVFLPPEFGYGSNGSRSGTIGPDQVLIFEIELIELK